MIFMKQFEKVPHASVIHAKLKGEESIQLYNILDAYKDLKKLIYGVPEMVKILDGIADKCYTLTETIYAGILLTDGLDGTYKDDYFSGKGKYVRIDNHDIVVIGEEVILTEAVFFKNGCFYADNGKVFRFKPKNEKKR